MFTGVSGLLNNGEAINVIGNNIANINTTAFKSSRTLFADMLYANIGNNSQIGRGMSMQKVDNLLAQGSTQNTTSVTDLALQGNSFFALKAPTTSSPVATQDAALLSRAGAFHVDKTLNLVNPEGYQVLDTQGYPIKFSDNSTAITAAAATFNTGATVAAAITAMTTDIATAQTAVTAMPAGAAKTAAQALVTAATTANTAATTANASLIASPSGSSALLANNAVAAAYLAVQAAATAAGGTSVAGSTTAVGNVTTAFAPVATEQGKAFSKITKVDSDGLITYLGTDGVTNLYYNTSGSVGLAATPANAATVQRLATISPADPGGLEKAGGNLYKPTTTAGISNAAFSLSTNAPNGTSNKVLSNSLEQSNVDMAAEFVTLIMTQRAYSANSKTITTADEMTQEVLNLKR